nr:alpha/beta hydrolase [uncultured Oscillibacter sp.]
MSIRYQIAKGLIKLTGIKKLFQLPQEELLKKAEQMNRKRQFRMPADDKARYADRMIQGCHCLTMETQPQKSNRALLFLFGGGMVIGSDAGDLKVARNMGKRSGRDVWFPYYPLCTDHSMLEATQMVYETYRQMLSDYRAEDIAVLGFSSGAGLALNLITYINLRGNELPMPGRMVLLSPGTCPADEAEFADMKALNDRDVLVDAAYMKTAGSIMAHGDPNVPRQLICITQGNFTGAPLTHFYYGGDEVLSACAKPFAAAYDKVGAKYTMHIEPGMCHCYPMLPYFPESKKAYEEIIGLLFQDRTA